MGDSATSSTLEYLDMETTEDGSQATDRMRRDDVTESGADAYWLNEDEDFFSKVLPELLTLGPVHTRRVSRFARKFDCKSFDVACNCLQCCVNTPIGNNVFHFLRATFASTASCVNGA